MKKTIAVLSVAVLLLSCLLCLSACGKDTSEEINLWKSAMYTSDVELGEGANMLAVQVKADNRQITFTIHTDKTTVGDAMMEHNLLEGEKQSAGLYIKKVNGIAADWNTDQTYWAFYINDEYAMTGADATNIESGVIYRLELSK